MEEMSERIEQLEKRVEFLERHVSKALSIHEILFTVYTPLVPQDPNRTDGIPKDAPPGVYVNYPQPDAKVAVKQLRGEEILVEAKTDSQGKCSITLPEGHYRVQASHENYADSNEGLESFAVEREETMYLKEKRLPSGSR